MGSKTMKLSFRRKICGVCSSRDWLHPSWASSGLAHSNQTSAHPRIARHYIYFPLHFCAKLHFISTSNPTSAHPTFASHCFVVRLICVLDNTVLYVHTLSTNLATTLSHYILYCTTTYYYVYCTIVYYNQLLYYC